jgi:hypothetical protein
MLASGVSENREALSGGIAKVTDLVLLNASCQIFLYSAVCRRLAGWSR